MTEFERRFPKPMDRQVPLAWQNKRKGWMECCNWILNFGDSFEQYSALKRETKKLKQLLED